MALTIASKWQEFNDQAVPGQCPESLRREFRKAFFAGAMIAFLEVEGLSMHPSEALRSFLYHSIREELMEFAKLGAEGKL